MKNVRNAAYARISAHMGCTISKKRRGLLWWPRKTVYRVAGDAEIYARTVRLIMWATHRIQMPKFVIAAAVATAVAAEVAIAAVQTKINYTE